MSQLSIADIITVIFEGDVSTTYVLNCLIEILSLILQPAPYIQCYFLSHFTLRTLC